jgi:uncharacterized protein (DUF1778 family)
MPKKPKQSGHDHARKAGLVPVGLLVTPEEHRLIGSAAFVTGQPRHSMGAFVRAAAVALARKVDRDPRLKDSENFSRFLETL